MTLKPMSEADSPMIDLVETGALILLFGSDVTD